MRFPTVLFVSTFVAASCGAGSAQPQQTVIGIWGKDAGTALLVFDIAGRTQWAAQRLVFDIIALELSTDCRDYMSTPDGGLSGPANANTTFTVMPVGEGRWRLDMQLPGDLVDSQYRLAGRGNPAQVQGTVSAEFDGGLTLHDGSVTFSYRMSYRDSVKALESEGAAVELPASGACR